MKPGVLLVNLGSPRSPSTKDVRAYLREFLGDPFVIDRPQNRLLRTLLVQGIIVPFRAPRSAHAYRSIWTENGAPLIHISRQVAEKLGETLSQRDVPVYLGMRYGSPSIRQALSEAKQDGVSHLLLIPQYPHYAASSWETVAAKTRLLIKKHFSHIKLSVLPPFFDDPDYIEALYQSARPWLEKPHDHLLFSYHGLPLRHLDSADKSGAHKNIPNDASPCCTPDMPSYASCYKAQVLATTDALAKRANISKDKYSISFQSRLLGEPWLSPYTDMELQRLAGERKENILVITPAFVADCLETLEEIAVTGKKIFLAKGGKHYFQIPCLNTDTHYINFLLLKSIQWLDHIT